MASPFSSSFSSNVFARQPLYGILRPVRISARRSATLSLFCSYHRLKLLSLNTITTFKVQLYLLTIQNLLRLQALFPAKEFLETHRTSLTFFFLLLQRIRYIGVVHQFYFFRRQGFERDQASIFFSLSVHNLEVFQNHVNTVSKSPSRPYSGLPSASPTLRTLYSRPRPAYRSRHHTAFCPSGFRSHVIIELQTHTLSAFNALPSPFR